MHLMHYVVTAFFTWNGILPKKIFFSNFFTKHANFHSTPFFMTKGILFDPSKFLHQNMFGELILVLNKHNTKIDDIASSEYVSCRHYLLHYNTTVLKYITLYRLKTRLLLMGNTVCIYCLSGVFQIQAMSLEQT